MSEEVTIASDLWELKKTKLEYMSQIKDLNVEIDTKEKALIDYLIEEGKSSTGKISNVGTFSLAKEHYPSVTAANMPLYISSIRGTDDFGMVKETIASTTLKKHLKGVIEEMEEYYVDNDAAFDRDMEALPENIEPTMSNVIKHKLSTVGVQMFDKVTLQHRNKGKA